uniref:Uncharacterized protein n=1 Tax=Brassica oleracea var. oleracea TaxID=109376 RepID=A0A0D3AVB2_BRAOL
MLFVHLSTIEMIQYHLCSVCVNHYIYHLSALFGPSTLPPSFAVAAPFLDFVCGVLRRNRRKQWQELILLDIKGRVRVWHDYHGEVSVAKAESFFSKLSGLGNILRQQHVASLWLLSKMVCALCKSGWLLDKLIKGLMLLGQSFSLYPGRSELPFLHANRQVVILQPLGDKGITLIGGNTIRCFTSSDQLIFPKKQIAVSTQPRKAEKIHHMRRSVQRTYECVIMWFKHGVEM